MDPADAVEAAPSSAPKRGGLVLIALILVAAVANLNLAVANVALPDDRQGVRLLADRARTSSRSATRSGSPASVLVSRRARRSLRAQDDADPRRRRCRSRRRLLAAYAPTDGVLFVARLVGGLAAGMAYPTTLALITALWSGPARTKSIALWSGTRRRDRRAGTAARRSAARALLVGLGVPHHAAAGGRSRSCMAIGSVPAHVNETTDPVDNLGGILSVAAGRRRSSSRSTSRRCPNEGALVARARRHRARRGHRVLRPAAPRARTRCTTCTSPARRIFWVAACAGIIVFGSLMGAMFIGQQFLQNVLGYSTLDAGAAILPAAFFMVLVAPRSAKLVEARGARFTLLVGLRLLPPRLPHDAAAVEGGHPVLAGRPRRTRSSGSASGSPARPRRTRSPARCRSSAPGMASGTADLQRDLGGAIMQSIFGRAADRRATPRRSRRRSRASPNKPQVTDERPDTAHEVVLERGGRRAAVPAVRDADHRGGQDVVPRTAPTGPTRPASSPILLGAALVFFLFPKKDEERRLLAEYHETDTRRTKADMS